MWFIVVLGSYSSSELAISLSGSNFMALVNESTHQYLVLNDSKKKKKQKTKERG
jgi:hypothetical protein